MKHCKDKSNIEIVKDYLAGVRPFEQISMHVTEKDKHRKDGEEWEQEGVKYRREKGKTVRVTKTQGDIIREAIGTGMDCKLCQMKWKWASEKDRKVMNRTGACSDCLIDYETKLRVLGIYDVYEKYRMGMYEMGHLKELRIKIQETIDGLERTGGDVVSLPENEFDNSVVWKNTNKDKELEHCRKDMAHLEELMKKGVEILDGFKKSYTEQIEKYNLQNILS